MIAICRKSFTRKGLGRGPAGPPALSPFMPTTYDDSPLQIPCQSFLCKIPAFAIDKKFLK